MPLGCMMLALPPPPFCLPALTTMFSPRAHPQSTTNQQIWLQVKAGPRVGGGGRAISMMGGGGGGGMGGGADESSGTALLAKANKNASTFTTELATGAVSPFTFGFLGI
jgi:hypothetical protein